MKWKFKKFKPVTDIMLWAKAQIFSLKVVKFGDRALGVHKTFSKEIFCVLFFFPSFHHSRFYFWSKSYISSTFNVKKSLIFRGRCFKSSDIAQKLSIGVYKLCSKSTFYCFSSIPLDPELTCYVCALQNIMFSPDGSPYEPQKTKAVTFSMAFYPHF